MKFNTHVSHQLNTVWPFDGCELLDESIQDLKAPE